MGGHMALRECGTCTLCCKLLTIDEPTNVESPGGEWCTHCEIGKGCKIFKESRRPLICNKFECGWLSNNTIPENLRPDQIGMVIARHGRKVILMLDKDVSHKWRKPEVVELVSAIMEQNHTLVYVNGKTVDLNKDIDMFTNMFIRLMG